MPRPRRARLRNLAPEHGFTLTELLIAMTALIGLLAVMGAGISLVARNQVRIADRSAQIQQGRAMIERFTRELREGSDVEDATGSGLNFLTFVRTPACGTPAPVAPTDTAIQCRVSYLCTAGRCTRSEGTPEGPGGTPVTVADGLRDTSAVFSYSPPTDPGHVGVRLEYPAQDGGESITLSDGAALRNETG
jgi:type II secretory pathway pseudopilin PulG